MCTANGIPSVLRCHAIGERQSRGGAGSVVLLQLQQAGELCRSAARAAAGGEPHLCLLGGGLLALGAAAACLLLSLSSCAGLRLGERLFLLGRLGRRLLVLCSPKRSQVPLPACSAFALAKRS